MSPPSSFSRDQPEQSTLSTNPSGASSGSFQETERSDAHSGIKVTQIGHDLNDTLAHIRMMQQLVDPATRDATSKAMNGQDHSNPLGVYTKPSGSAPQE